MKPSDAELNELLRSAQWIDLAEDSHGVELSMRQTKTAMQLAKAELQRRQQPASVPESVRRLMEYAGKQRREVNNPCITANEAIEIANHFSAYAREQTQGEI